MESENRNFITREEFETHLKYLREEIKLREQIAERGRSFEKNFEDLKAKTNEIKEEFRKMRDGISEMRSEFKSMSRKLDRINIFLCGQLFFCGLWIVVLMYLVKKIGG